MRAVAVVLLAAAAALVTAAVAIFAVAVPAAAQCKDECHGGLFVAGLIVAFALLGLVAAFVGSLLLSQSNEIRREGGDLSRARSRA